MVDIATAFGRVRGMVVQPQETLAQHTRPVPPWGVVAREHTLPLLIGSSVVSSLLLWLLMPMMAIPGMEAMTPGFGFVALRLAANVVVNFVLIALMAGVVMVFAGMFGGRADYDRSYVLVALALTPLFAAEAVVPIPLIGMLAFLGGLIYALVILYRNTPAVLGLPPENRTKHFLLTLATMFLLSTIVAFVFAGLVIAAFG